MHEKNSNEAIEKEINGNPLGSVIWLHGLGADGHDFEPIVNELDIPEELGIRFVFPHAPYRPITINGGMNMRAWYDVTSLDRKGAQDEQGIRQSSSYLEKLIDQENKRGIPHNRIIVAGFSQGGAIVLHASLRYPQRLGGLIALSTWLPLESTLEEEVTNNENSQPSDLPIFLAHGKYDPVIPFDFGLESKYLIEKNGYLVNWHEYLIEHSVSQQEIKDIGCWISGVMQA
ncbi:MAG TPA: carboxylesterase [Woeseiaceae bacterium]|nr:carboxylesterase [Woeseiaceae bacterium]|tara:strand:- start:19538 stop:20227 length:690 start_codon:yes stop_codon:yes gene_type:complete